MKKFILPVTLFIFGAGAAFATNTAQKQETAIVKGYRITSDEMAPCERTEVDCTTVPTPNLCTDGSLTLHQIDGTSCGSDLFEP